MDKDLKQAGSQQAGSLERSDQALGAAGAKALGQVCAWDSPGGADGEAGGRGGDGRR